jgi:hypothetical protein
VAKPKPLQLDWAEQERKLEQFQAKVRNIHYGDASKSGAIQQQMAAMTQFGRQMDLMTAKVRNETAAHDLASGAYAKHAASIGTLNRQYAQQQKQMAMVNREEDLTAKYGRAGGFYARNERMINVATGVAAVGAVTVGAIANRGFQGTVEQNRADYAGKMLDRQVASIFAPLKDLETGIKMGAARYLQGLNGNQQNTLMYAGVGVSSLLALRGLGAAASMFHDMRGAARAQAGAAGVGPFGGAAGGMIGKATLAAIPIAIGAIASSQGYSAAGYGIGGLAGMGHGIYARAPGTSAMRAGAKGLATGVALTAAGSFIDTAFDHSGDYYQAQRKAGHGEAISALSAGGASAIETLLKPFGLDKEYFKGVMKSRGYTPESEVAAHRAVTIAGAGFESADESFDRLQTSFSAMEALIPENKRSGPIVGGHERTMMEAEAAGAYGPGIRTGPETEEEENAKLKEAIEKLTEAIVKNGGFTMSGDSDGSWLTRALVRPDGS